MRLLFASSHDPDLLYIYPDWLADPAVVFIDDEKSHIFLDQREYDIALEMGLEHLVVEHIDGYLKEARGMVSDGPLWGKVMVSMCRRRNLSMVEVSPTFPYHLGKFLEQNGVAVTVLPQLLPIRREKSLVEVQYIEKVQRATEGAFQRIHDILSESRIGAENELIFQEEALTSEYLKKIVALHLLENDAFLQEGVIISHGAQAAIPHHSGHGVLKAHEAIVCDIFPRSTTSFYFADMTRTFCKGEPSKELARMYQAVKKAQEAACALVGPEVDGMTVHKKCIEVFDSYGFKTTAEEGFVHSTGHGVGLEIHEYPRLSSGSCMLKAGDIVTVEPGLYYKAWGGVRIEDMMYIKEDGARNLTQFPKELVIE